MGRNYFFSIRQVNLIRNHYRTHTDKQLAHMCGRNEKAIKHFRRRHGLYKRLRQSPVVQPTKRIARGIRQKKGESPFRYVRLPSGAYITEQKQRWEEKHGPIASGHLLFCLSEDTLNTHPENWQLLTRSEWMRQIRQTNKRAAGMRQTWEKIHRLEANGIPHRYGWRTNIKPVTTHTPARPDVNRHTDFQF